tara:strand:- start:27 stop:329 length:303 start_codon:yes stop_codon:yes gene_type:complete
MEKETLKISFDNAGGITLETSEYCHYYTDARDAAEDASCILGGMTTQEWDGNEPEHRLNEAETQHFYDDIARIVAAPFCEDNHRGIAEINFYKTIKGAKQ